MNYNYDNEILLKLKWRSTGSTMSRIQNIGIAMYFFFGFLCAIGGIKAELTLEIWVFTRLLLSCQNGTQFECYQLFSAHCSLFM